MYSTVTDTLEHPLVGVLKLANPIKDTCTLSSFFLKDLPCNCKLDTRPRLQIHTQHCKRLGRLTTKNAWNFMTLDLEYGPESKLIISIYVCVCVAGNPCLAHFDWGCVSRDWTSASPKWLASRDNKVQLTTTQDSKTLLSNSLLSLLRKSKSVNAHCPNTGSLQNQSWYSRSFQRKMRW